MGKVESPESAATATNSDAVVAAVGYTPMNRDVQDVARPSAQVETEDCIVFAARKWSVCSAAKDGDVRYVARRVVTDAEASGRPNAAHLDIDVLQARILVRPINGGIFF